MGAARMSIRSRELYRSANGDRWSLVRDAESGRVIVRHEVGDVLVRGGLGPEKQELLRLIGTLVDGGIERS